MAIKRIEATVKATGTDKTTLAKGKTAEFKGTRLAVVCQDGYDRAAFIADCDALMEQIQLGEHKLSWSRLAEVAVDAWLGVRCFQDANRLALADGETLDQATADKYFLERALAQGKHGAKGPRLSDQEVLDAALGLAKSNSAYQSLADLVNNAKLTQLAEVKATLRAAYNAAELTVEQVKAFAAAK